MTMNLNTLLTPEVVAFLLRPEMLALIWLGNMAWLVGRYFVFSGGFYWFYYKRSGGMRPGKIQPEAPYPGQVWNEIRWSLSSHLVFSVMTMALLVAGLKGWTRIYLDVADYGLGYTIASFFLMVLIHDFYFYMTHMLSHRIRFIFRRFHRIHHQSTNPTPFADQMFHPVDAVIHGGFAPLFLFTLPLHPVPLSLFLGMVQLMNAVGHIGYEVFPPPVLGNPIARWIVRPTSHNIHHSRVHCNYGVYFFFWDRIFGTEWKEPEGKALLSAAEAVEAELTRAG